jgi:hypothetical protein
VSFPGAWRNITVDDYRLIAGGRVTVGDAVCVVPSGVTSIRQTDEWWLKNGSNFFNVTYKQDQMVGSQIAFYEVGLTVGRGRR